MAPENSHTLAMEKSVLAHVASPTTLPIPHIFPHDISHAETIHYLKNNWLQDILTELLLLLVAVNVCKICIQLLQASNAKDLTNHMAASLKINVTH